MGARLFTDSWTSWCCHIFKFVAYKPIVVDYGHIPLHQSYLVVTYYQCLFSSVVFPYPRIFAASQYIVFVTTRIHEYLIIHDSYHPHIWLCSRFLLMNFCSLILTHCKGCIYKYSGWLMVDYMGESPTTRGNTMAHDDPAIEDWYQHTTLCWRQIASYLWQRKWWFINMDLPPLIAGGMTISTIHWSTLYSRRYVLISALLAGAQTCCAGVGLGDI